MSARNVLTVKLPRELLDEAREAVAGVVPMADGRRTVASAVGYLLEMYLINYPDVTYLPTTRGRTAEAPEAQVCVTTDEGVASMLEAFMREERRRLEERFRLTPRDARESKRPPKPEYRGLVIAAIKEGTHTRCYGCK